MVTSQRHQPLDSRRTRTAKHSPATPRSHPASLPASLATHPHTHTSFGAQRQLFLLRLLLFLTTLSCCWLLLPFYVNRTVFGSCNCNWYASLSCNPLLRTQREREGDSEIDPLHCFGIIDSLWWWTYIAEVYCLSMESRVLSCFWLCLINKLSHLQSFFCGLVAFSLAVVKMSNRFM